MTPIFFATQAKFRAWLRKHHRTERELWVGFYKKGSGKSGMSYPESVDEALCWGWIDGIRKRLDDERFVQRFTPRRPTSIWSAVNVQKIADLERAGRMQPAGRAIYDARDKRKMQGYSFEQEKAATFSPAQLKPFRANKPAWKFWEAQAPWYRRLNIYRVVSAKKAETRARRLAKLIEASAEGRRL